MAASTGTTTGSTKATQRYLFKLSRITVTVWLLCAHTCGGITGLDNVGHVKNSEPGVDSWTENAQVNTADDNQSDSKSPIKKDSEEASGSAIKDHASLEWWPWNKKNDSHHHHVPKNATGCASHMACDECTWSSWNCHWCAHDNACHAVGSVYGCMTGVSCYSNDICKRKTPEPLEGHTSLLDGIGPLALLLIFSVALFCLCCSSLGFFAAGSVKGAYDDLAEPCVNDENLPHSCEEDEVNQEHQSFRNVHEEKEGLFSRLFASSRVLVNADENSGEASSLLLTAEHDDDESGYRVLEEPPHEEDIAVGDELEACQDPPLREGSNTKEQVCWSRNMDCLCSACTFCYILSLLCIAATVFGTIFLYPRFPDYNFCNDRFAWKSIVDGMASFKVEASFELLVSIRNPNRFGVKVDMGSGTLSHKGALVGTFVIPPTLAEARTITDVFITATVTPEKWKALQLTTEYYENKLWLTADSKAIVEVPAFGGYSFVTTFNDMAVHVAHIANETESPRFLCACPSWDNARNSSHPTLFLN